MMGDLPEWKRERGVSFLWVTYPERRKKYGLVVMGDLPKEKYGLIVMGDLPKEKKKRGLILWVTCPGEGMASFFG